MANILLVDDEPLVRETLSAAMASKGHRVAVAANGVQGLKKLAENAFDLVITDIVMPDMEGIGLIREIRRKVPDAKIVAISGGGRTGNVEFLKMARNLGAMATMKKPIRLGEFFQVLDECLKENPNGTNLIPARR